MSYFVLGIGAVGYSFIKILKKENIIDFSLLYCIENEDKGVNKFLDCGGRIENVIQVKVTKENYKNVLKLIEPGDYLLDFSNQVNNVDVLKYCLKNKIHYLSTADSYWEDDTSWVSNYKSFLSYKKLKRKYNKKCATSLVMFGMNPGLVSAFVKKCIGEIIINDKNDFVAKNRDILLDLKNKNEYGKICKTLGVKIIKEIDVDDQQFDVNVECNKIYSPWCPVAFYSETTSCPEIVFGDFEKFLQYKNIISCNIRDMVILLQGRSYQYEEKSYSPQGEVVGFICPHEEIYTIRDYFSTFLYKPTCYFVYKPSTQAHNSIINVNKNEKIGYILLEKEKLISGGESVGIIIQGDNFSTRYFGNYLRNNNVNDLATILQVSASAYAGFKYMLDNSNNGLLFPEEVDEDYVLEIAKKYLGDYISTECGNIQTDFGFAVNKNIDK